jgi:hypothetical protein
MRIGKHVRMRVAALAGDGVYRLHIIDVGVLLEIGYLGFHGRRI